MKTKKGWFIYLVFVCLLAILLNGLCSDYPQFTGLLKFFVIMGTLIGILIGSLTVDKEHTYSKVESVFLGVIPGGVIGLTAGLIIGSNNGGGLGLLWGLLYALAFYVPFLLLFWPIYTWIENKRQTNQPPISSENVFSITGEF